MVNEIKLSTKAKGQIAQLKVELRAAQLDYSIARPSTDCSYDLIIDTGVILIRTQIKYCDRRASHSPTNLELRLDDKKSKREYYQSHHIDAVMVYVPKVDSVLFFNASKFHKKKTVYINLKDQKSKFFWKKFKW
jgi:hypothetical protein